MKFRGILALAILGAVLSAGGCSSAVNVFGWMAPGTNSTDVNSLIALGNSDMNKGDYTNALVCFDNALHFSPTNAQALEGASTAYIFVKVPIQNFIDAFISGGQPDYSKIGINNLYAVCSFVAPKLEMIVMGKADSGISSNDNTTLINYFVFNTLSSVLQFADMAGDGNLISNTNDIIYFTNNSPLGYYINLEITNSIGNLTNSLLGDLTDQLVSWTNTLMSNAMSNINYLTNQIFSNLNNGINTLTNNALSNFSWAFNLTNVITNLSNQAIGISNESVKLSNDILALDSNSNNFLASMTLVSNLRQDWSNLYTNIVYLTNQIDIVTDELAALPTNLVAYFNTNISNFINTNISNVTSSINSDIGNFITNTLLTFINTNVFNLLYTNTEFNDFLNNPFVKDVINIAPKYNRLTNAINNSFIVVGRITNELKSSLMRQELSNFTVYITQANNIQTELTNPATLLGSNSSADAYLGFISGFLTNGSMTKSSIISNFIGMGESFVPLLTNLNSLIPSNFTNQLNTYTTNLNVFNLSQITNYNFATMANSSNYSLPDLSVVFSNMNAAFSFSNMATVLGVTNANAAVVMTTLLSNSGATNLSTLSTQLTNADTNLQVGNTNQILTSTVTLMTNTYPDLTNDTASLYAALSNQYGL
jgi:hypothetical protein